MVTAERISFGGFTIAFKLTEMIYDFAAGELVILLAAPARAQALALGTRFHRNTSMDVNVNITSGGTAPLCIGAGS
jgi:hypothetical protein